MIAVNFCFYSKNKKNILNIPNQLNQKHAMPLFLVFSVSFKIGFDSLKNMYHECLFHRKQIYFYFF